MLECYNVQNQSERMLNYREHAKNVIVVMKTIANPFDTDSSLTTETLS